MTVKKMLSATSDWRRMTCTPSQPSGEPDRHAARRAVEELEHGVAERERALDRRDERDAVGDERGGVVDHRLALDEQPHPVGRPDPRERGRGRDRVGRPDDRAEHERRLPAHPRHDRVRHDGDDDHRDEHEPDRQQRERPISALSSRGDEYQPAACSSGGRKTRKTTSGSSSRSGSAGTKPIARPPSTSTIGYGTRDQLGQPDEHGGGRQQQDQELDVAHGAGNSRIRRPCPTA